MYSAVKLYTTTFGNLIKISKDSTTLKEMLRNNYFYPTIRLTFVNYVSVNIYKHKEENRVQQEWKCCVDLSIKIRDTNFTQNIFKVTIEADFK